MEATLKSYGNLLKPVIVDYTAVNMLRDPYKKKRPAVEPIQKNTVSFQGNFDILFDTFFESYVDYKAGKMPQEKDAERRRFGIPASSQYCAFEKFIALFKKEEFVFSKPTNSYYWYDVNILKNKLMKDSGVKKDVYNMAVIEYLQKMISFDFKDTEKEITIASGSFWQRVPSLRKVIIGYLKQLRKKEVKIVVYMQAERDEDDDMKELSLLVEPQSRFGLKERIPIHFVLCGNDYLLFEFPHTEDVIVRLDMFMDLVEMENKQEYKKGTSRLVVVQLLNTFINEVLPQNARK